MTNRELLELAAKAAGIEVGEWMEIGVHSGFAVDYGIRPNGLCWNPLTDDGDALRLAVRLGFKVFHEFGKTVVINYAYEAVIREDYSSNGNDALAATRRAITRAAASMGKAMP